jgi:hypothetical protein
LCLRVQQIFLFYIKITFKLLNIFHFDFEKMKIIG